MDGGRSCVICKWKRRVIEERRQEREGAKEKGRKRRGKRGGWVGGWERECVWGLDGWLCTKCSAMVHSVLLEGRLSAGLPCTSFDLSRTQSSSRKAVLCMYDCGSPGATSMLIPVDRRTAERNGVAC